MPKHRLKAIREEKGITQKELAAMVGVSVYYMNRVENHRIALNTKLAILIADKLNVSLDEIFLR